MERSPVTDAHSAKPRLVFFHSRASGPARRIDAFLASVLQRSQNHDAFRFQRVIVDDHPALADHFRVNGVPTLFVIEGTRVLARIENPRGARSLSAALAPWLRSGHAPPRNERAES
jgi:thioredoxin-like negative regulator of GroEL